MYHSETPFPSELLSIIIRATYAFNTRKHGADHVMPVTLSNLRHIRRTRFNLTPAVIVDIAAPMITKERYSKLESLTAEKRLEPWLDEAALFARILNTDGILPLIGSDNLTDVDAGIDVGLDIPALHAGARLPLSMAVRLAQRFHLRDPINLLILEMLPLEIWSVLKVNERGAAPGECVWCRGVGNKHLPTCMPHALWGRMESKPEDLPVRPKPQRLNGRGGAGMAPGLRPLRDSLKMTQGAMAARVGIAENTWARMERCEYRLVQDTAEKIVAAFGGSLEQLYSYSLNGLTAPVGDDA